MTLDSSPLTLNSSQQAPYCGIAADTARQILREASTLNKLTSDLTRSLRRPGRRTLTLIDRALGWLRPFESARATAASDNEKRELLELLTTHRMVLTPYLDIDSIESHLRRG